jgi:hypothetical protein
VRLIFGEDDRVAEWVGEKLGLKMFPPYVAIGGTIDGPLCIGVVFNNWNGFNFDISLYGPNALTRGAIRSVYHYAFIQAGAERLTAITKRSNENMQELLPRFGFTFEGESPKYFGEEDAMRFCLLKETAEKWMR